MRSLSPEDYEKATRPLTGPEKKYGRNEWHELELCPRCECANPVKVVPNFKTMEVELHSKKCIKLGHKDGSLIRTVPMETNPRRIMDG